MKNILIVEDDEIQICSLKLILKEYNNDFSIYTATNASEASSIYTNTNIDIFILDVDLSLADSDKNGIGVGLSIRAIKQYHNTPIIYITGIPEKVQSALNDVHCIFYLDKPYKPTDVYHALDYITHNDVNDDSTFLLRDPNGIRIAIKYADVFYIESSRHVLTFHTCNGTFSSREMNLTDIMSSFPSHFARVHKSYVINTSYITAYDKTNRTIVINRKSIRIGRTYKDAFELIYA